MASTNVMFREPPGTTGRSRHLSEREAGRRTSEANVGQVEARRLGGPRRDVALARARPALARRGGGGRPRRRARLPGRHRALPSLRGARGRYRLRPRGGGRGLGGRPGGGGRDHDRQARRGARPPLARSADPDADHIRVRRGDARGRRPDALEGPGPARAGLRMGHARSSRTGRAGVSAGSRSRGRPCRARARSASAPAPGDRGTEVTLRIRFDPPGGALGLAAAKLLGFVPRLFAERAIHYFRAPGRDGRDPHHRPAAGRTRRHPLEEDIPMRALYWNGVNDLRVGTVPDPTIVNPHDAILQGDAVDDLRLGPALHRRLPADDEARRHHRPRVHGRGGRDRPRGEEGQEGRPRGRPLVHRLRPVLVLPEPALLALRQHAPEARAAGADVRLPDGRHLRLHPRLRRLRRVARRVRPRARSPTTTASTPPRACPTSRCSSSPTPPPPATWAPTSATSSPATRSPSGAAAASGSWRSGAPTCWGPSG